MRITFGSSSTIIAATVALLASDVQSVHLTSTLSKHTASSELAQIESTVETETGDIEQGSAQTMPTINIIDNNRNMSTTGGGMGGGGMGGNMMPQMMQGMPMGQNMAQMGGMPQMPMGGMGMPMGGMPMMPMGQNMAQTSGLAMNALMRPMMPGGFGRGMMGM